MIQEKHSGNQCPNYQKNEKFSVTLKKKHKTKQQKHTLIALARFPSKATFLLNVAM